MVSRHFCGADDMSFHVYNENRQVIFFSLPYKDGKIGKNSKRSKKIKKLPSVK